MPPAYESSDEESYGSVDEEELAEELAAQQGSSIGLEEREFAYNAEAIHEKLEDIGWVEQAPWSESLVLTSSAPTVVENVDADLERELAFYNQALEGAKEAIRRFEDAGVKWRRPDDYYADMVKSDEHMARVKQQLVYEQKSISEMEQRRKERESKKFAKAVQAEKVKERAQAKKAAITEVTALRKQRAKSGYKGELDLDEELSAGKGNAGQPAANKGAKKYQPPEKSRKRAARDAKFGFGGPKRRSKQNDARSTASVDGGRRGGSGWGGPGGGVSKKGAAAKRPGKARRAAARK